MPGQSPKEVCFNTAVETLQALREQAGNPLPYRIDTQMPWTKNFAAAGNRWLPVPGPFKKWYYIYGYLKNKLGAGHWQVRYPDATITYNDGSRQVLDCKFTRGDGSPDRWGTTAGKYSSRTQLRDYTEINAEQGHPTIGPPELSRVSCQCDEKEKKKELKPREIPIPELAPGTYFMPVPAPGGLRLPGGAPAPAPVRIPLRLPIPVFP
jgi:hypothetical protein